MKTFIANFGRMNYLWPACFARPSVATIEDKDLRALWLAGDREGYIALCIASKKTQKGLTPTRQVASRWFNLAHIISATENDLWIHREKDELWWTISRADGVEVLLQPGVDGTSGNQVYELHKPTDPWSNQTRQGNALNWPRYILRRKTSSSPKARCRNRPRITRRMPEHSSTALI